MRKILIIVLALLVLAAGVSALSLTSDCVILSSCPAGYNAIASTYSDTNSHVIRNPSTGSMKLCCKGSGVEAGPTSSCSGDEAPFYVYQDSNSHIFAPGTSGQSGTAVCLGSDSSGLNCYFVDGDCPANECVASAYDTENSHISECGDPNAPYEICCGATAPTCGDGSWSPPGEECEYSVTPPHWGCIDSPPDDCTCGTGNYLDEDDDNLGRYGCCSDSPAKTNYHYHPESGQSKCCAADQELHCVINFGAWFCTCTSSNCGDGTVEGDEECESPDGGATWGEGCLTDGTCKCDSSSGYSPADPPGIDCVGGLCGNGQWDDGEQCDGGTGCEADCTCDFPDWVPDEPPGTDCVSNPCGDGNLDPGEECEYNSTSGTWGEGCSINGCTCNGNWMPYDPVQIDCKLKDCTDDDDCNYLDDECNEGRCSLSTWTCRTEQLTDGTSCSSNSQCTYGECYSGTCEQFNESSGTSCDDGDGCTIGDSCDGNGNCLSGSPKSCSKYDLPAETECVLDDYSVPFSLLQQGTPYPNGDYDLADYDAANKPIQTTYDNFHEYKSYCVPSSGTCTVIEYKSNFEETLKNRTTYDCTSQFNPAPACPGMNCVTNNDCGSKEACINCVCETIPCNYNGVMELPEQCDGIDLGLPPPDCRDYSPGEGNYVGGTFGCQDCILNDSGCECASADGIGVLQPGPYNVSDKVTLNCTMSHPNLASVNGSVNGVKCNYRPDLYKGNNYYYFDCILDNLGNNVLECTIETDIDCMTGPPQTMTLTTSSSTCTGKDQTSCLADSNCDWCYEPDCSKFSVEGNIQPPTDENGPFISKLSGNCVDKGSCGSRYCNVNTCGAQCDIITPLPSCEDLGLEGENEVKCDWATCLWDTSDCKGCGNGNLEDPPEECDYAYSGAGPSCLNNCSCDTGYTGDGFGGCYAECGDGIWVSDEECDNAPNCNLWNEPNPCMCEKGYIPDGSGGCVEDCGDGTIVGNEECDGSNLNGEDCVSLNFYSGTLGCDSTCKFDTSGCVDSYCGDGTVQNPNYYGENESCELPSTNDNTDCSQATGDCLGNKTNTRDAFGDCDASCGCVEDANDYQCVIGSCNAECSPGDFGGKDCTAYNFAGGSLDCSTSCTIGTSGCECGEVTALNFITSPIVAGPPKEYTQNSVIQIECEANYITNGYNATINGVPCTWDPSHPGELFFNCQAITLGLQDVRCFVDESVHCSLGDKTEQIKIVPSTCTSTNEATCNATSGCEWCEEPDCTATQINPPYDFPGDFFQVNHGSCVDVGNCPGRQCSVDDCGAECDSSSPAYDCTADGWTGTAFCDTTICDWDKSSCCGDGITGSAEECDLGLGNNNNNGDCLLDCTNATCGDGFVWNLGTGTEQCDDGNSANGDGCFNCQSECGDGVWDQDGSDGYIEECDASNTNCLPWNDANPCTCDIGYQANSTGGCSPVSAECYNSTDPLGDPDLCNYLITTNEPQFLADSDCAINVPPWDACCFDSGAGKYLYGPIEIIY